MSDNRVESRARKQPTPGSRTLSPARWSDAHGTRGPGARRIIGLSISGRVAPTPRTPKVPICDVVNATVARIDGQRLGWRAIET
jgi:hypothetical protein